MEITINGNTLTGPYSVQTFQDVFRIIDANIVHVRPSSISQPVGTATVEEFRVTKEIDSGSPDFHDALFRNLNVNEATFYFLAMDTQNNTLSVVYQITLENARIVRVQNQLVHQGNNQFAHLETLSFVYQRITIDDPNGTSVQYDFFNN